MNVRRTAGENVVSAVDVATHWHDHFPINVSSNEKILNDQAICFFQVAAGAELGSLVVGRKGAPTRFEFIAEKIAALAGLGEVGGGLPGEPVLEEASGEPEEGKVEDFAEKMKPARLTGGVSNNKVFITHGKNKKVLDQIERDRGLRQLRASHRD